MEIRVEELEKSLDGRKIIERINLAVKDKETVGVIGPNGSGKSTLLKCIYRVLEPELGKVCLGADAGSVRARVGNAAGGARAASQHGL